MTTIPVRLLPAAALAALVAQAEVIIHAPDARGFDNARARTIKSALAAFGANAHLGFIGDFANAQISLDSDEDDLSVAHPEAGRHITWVARMLQIISDASTAINVSPETFLTPITGQEGDSLQRILNCLG